MRAWAVCAALAPLACAPTEGTEGSAGGGADAPGAAAWPAGTVMVVGGSIPIHASEVDPYLPAIALIEPRFVEKQLVRLALTNVVLPRAVARALAGEEAHARARSEAEAAREAIVEGRWVGPAMPGTSGGALQSGTYSTLGLERWAAAFDLEPGAWSPVFEEIGAFTFLRCVRRSDGMLPIQTEFEIEVASYFYLPPEEGLVRIERGYDEVRLEILDPEWRTIVPELLQYRMGVHSP